MDIPYSVEAVTDGIKDVIRANGLNACYIRPWPPRVRRDGREPAERAGQRVHRGLAVGRVPRRGRARAGRPDQDQQLAAELAERAPAAAKATGQYINSVLAKVESLKAGYDEAIMLNEAGFITDGSGENVFVVRDGVLTTPPIAGRVPGRHHARQRDRRSRATSATTVREENLVRTDLYNADEGFFTGTAAEITPIREVDDRAVGEGHRGPVTKELQGAFFAATKGETERYADWLTYVTD